MPSDQALSTIIRSSGNDEERIAGALTAGAKVGLPIGAELGAMRRGETLKNDGEGADGCKAWVAA